jgi:N-ethylmaleimide reductase
MSDLFESFALGDLPLPSRIVMAPMTRRRAGEGKVPTELTVLYYAQRAGAGLIITESIEVDPFSGVVAPTRPGLFSAAQQAGWAKVTKAVHEAGGRIFAQLSHMGRAAHSSQLVAGGRVVGPSPIASTGTMYTPQGPLPYETPHELSKAEIGTIVGQYTEAARLARAAGFDGIELHGANGYLIDQFLRDGSNQRHDSYGGTARKRARFLLEIIEAVGAFWPSGWVGVRVSPTNSFQGMSDSDPVNHFAEIAKALSAKTLAYIHVVEPPVQPDGVPQVAATIRQHFDGPLILASKYDFYSGTEALVSGLADLVAFGEAFIANPDLPERLRRSAPLNTPDKSTFYTPGAKGYTDYPFLEA